jgi:hypothetical protein
MAGPDLPFAHRVAAAAVEAADMVRKDRLISRKSRLDFRRLNDPPDHPSQVPDGHRCAVAGPATRVVPKQSAISIVRVATTPCLVLVFRAIPW